MEHKLRWTKENQTQKDIPFELYLHMAVSAVQLAPYFL